MRDGSKISDHEAAMVLLNDLIRSRVYQSPHPLKGMRQAQHSLDDDATVQPCIPGFPFPECSAPESLIVWYLQDESREEDGWA